MPLAIKIQDLNIAYHYNVVLKNINLEINQHDFISIIGPNGGGKTTLLKAILGFIKPQAGEIKIFGQSPFKARSQIGYVPQMEEFDRNFPISVFDVVLMGRYHRVGLIKKYSKQDNRTFSRC